MPELKQVRPQSRSRSRRIVYYLLLLTSLGLGGTAAWWAWGRKGAGETQRLDLLYEAWRHFDRGARDAAAAALDRREDLVHPTPLDWMLRARIAEAQGRPADGLSYLRQIPDSDPTAAQAWLKAGQLEVVLRHARGAEAAFRRSLRLDPAQVQCHRELAYLYGIQRRWEDCDRQYRALAARMTLDHVLLFAWCQNLCRLWDPDGAGTVLREFLDADPDDRQSRLALAVSLIMTHHRDEAEAALAALGDSDSDALAIRLQNAIDRADVGAAEELARHGASDHPRLNVARGTLALRANDPSRAAPLFRAALKANPEERDAIHGLGLALRRVSDPRANEYLEAAERYDQLRRTILDSVVTIHSDPTLFRKLGKQCESLQRLEQARGWYRLAIGRDPLDEEAQSGLGRVEHLLAGPGAPAQSGGVPAGR